MRKLNCKQERLLLCGCVACTHVLIFAVIGHNARNIPKIFQVSTVFPVALKRGYVTRISLSKVNSVI